MIPFRLEDSVVQDLLEDTKMRQMKADGHCKTCARCYLKFRDDGVTYVFDHRSEDGIIVPYWQHWFSGKTMCSCDLKLGTDGRGGFVRIPWRVTEEADVKKNEDHCKSCGWVREHCKCEDDGWHHVTSIEKIDGERVVHEDGKIKGKKLETVSPPPLDYTFSIMIDEPKDMPPVKAYQTLDAETELAEVMRNFSTTSMSLAEIMRKEQGLCIQCGEGGTWISMALMCPEHGRIMG